MKALAVDSVRDVHTYVRVSPARSVSVSRSIVPECRWAECWRKEPRALGKNRAAVRGARTVVRVHSTLSNALHGQPVSARDVVVRVVFFTRSVRVVWKKSQRRQRHCSVHQEETPPTRTCLFSGGFRLRTFFSPENQSYQYTLCMVHPLSKMLSPLPAK